jgi:hypothetical protein
MLKNWAVQKRTESSLLTSGKDAMETLERQAFLRKYNNEKCYEFKGSKPNKQYHCFNSVGIIHTWALKCGKLADIIASNSESRNIYQ